MTYSWVSSVPCERMLERLSIEHKSHRINMSIHIFFSQPFKSLLSFLPFLSFLIVLYYMIYYFRIFHIYFIIYILVCDLFFNNIISKIRFNILKINYIT